ncbi:hypothetical protein DFH07DRAFT_683355, partial [Mycena maculata]
WHDLKHISSPTAINYSDGQTFLDILKQHFLSHAIENFKAKGTSRNMNTRVGEGFQQEISTQYKKTNGKNVEHQMSIMDETEETMAQIDMLVQQWHENQLEVEDEGQLLPTNSKSLAHWKLGSPESRVSTICIEA